ncbi:MAG: histidine phosphatase family protein, partial [Haloplanus sp.]
MTTVLLARHGETTWNRDGRLQGWAPTPLTDRGHDQARALAAAVAADY